MKKFSEMSLQELEQLVNRSKKLREEFDSYIADCEMGWLTDKLACFKSSLCDWSVGFYQPNYMTVKDYDGFLDGVIESAKSFGASDKLEKKIEQCKKLRGSNLFEYNVKQLKDLYMKEEIDSICDYVEDCGYELYCGRVGEKSRDFLNCFFECSRFDGYLYDEETETYYKPTKLDVA